MPSKGVDLYSFIASDPFTSLYSIKFEVPEKSFTNTSADNFSIKHLEVQTGGPRVVVGRFQWTALYKGNAVASGWNDVNALTGKLERGTMMSTRQITPVILTDAIICYGFYEAGSGEYGLPSSHQCYVTITPLRNAWMRSIAPPGSDAAKQPFSKLVLPAAHDAGMHDMTTMDAVLSVARVTDLRKMRKTLPQLQALSFVPDKVALPMLQNIVYGLAYTQKKAILDMLLLGCRYFEWRPAKLLPAFRDSSGLPDKYYFTHGPIPGMSTDDFLEDVVSFLDQNNDELVVIHFRDDGIAKDCKQPTSDEIDGLVSTAVSKSKAGLQWGRRECFAQSISSLRSAQKRLICVTMAAKYDSYDDTAYATLKADPILARFEAMEASGQLGSDLTILQCQATATNIKPVVAYSVLTADAGDSCLTATKALLDRHTLPWIRDNLEQRLSADRNVIIMNDFIDGATAQTAIDLSQQRLKQG